MDNLNLLCQLRESLVNALREIRTGHLQRAKIEIEDAFATSTTMLGLQSQGGGAGGPADMKDVGEPGMISFRGQGGHDPTDGCNIQQGVHEFPSQGAAGPPGYSGPGLSLDEARAIQRAGGIQVRKTPEWQMNLAKTTQARYIADLMVMEAWAVDYASEAIERRIHDELYKEFDDFDNRLLEELKDGQH